MDAVLNEVAPQLIPHRITADNARIMAQKRWEAQRERERREKEEAQAIIKAQADDKDGLKARTREIEALIAEVIVEMHSAKDLREKQAGAMALDRLYGTWALLTGHERPGVRKSVSRRQPSSMEPTAPIPPIEPIA